MQSGLGSKMAGARHKDVLEAPVPGDEDGKNRLVDEIKRRGNAAFKMKSMPEAIVLYSRAIEISGEQAALWGNRSMAHCAMGAFDLALSDAEEACKVDTLWAKGHFRRGKALNGLHRFKEAFSAFDKAASMSDGKAAKAARAEAKNALIASKQQPEDAAPMKKKKAKKIAAAPRKAESKTTPSKALAEAKSSKTTPSSSNGMRGYRILEDGRKTTYFNMERTEEEKALIGDIRPKKIDNVDQINFAAKEGASAWNAGATFEEREMTSWAKDWLKSNLTAISCRIEGGEAKGDASAELSVVDITDVEGDASVTFTRKKLCHIFDFSFSVKWKVKIDALTTVEGKLFIPDFNGDLTMDEEIEAELRWSDRSKAGPMERIIREVIMSRKEGGMRFEVEATLREFREAFLSM